MFGWLRKVMWDLLHFFFEEKRKGFIAAKLSIPFGCFAQ
jgi:hypothetical protein